MQGLLIVLGIVVAMITAMLLYIAVVNNSAIDHSHRIGPGEEKLVTVWWLWGQVLWFLFVAIKWLPKQVAIAFGLMKGDSDDRSEQG